MKYRHQSRLSASQPSIDYNFVWLVFFATTLLSLLITAKGLFFPAEVTFGLPAEYLAALNLNAGLLGSAWEFFRLSFILCALTFLLPTLVFRLLAQWGWRDLNMQRVISILTCVVFLFLSAKLHFSRDNPRIWLISRALFSATFLAFVSVSILKSTAPFYSKFIRFVAVAVIATTFVSLEYWKSQISNVSLEKKKIILFVAPFTANDASSALDAPALQSLRQRLVQKDVVYSVSAHVVPQILTAMSGLTPDKYEIRNDYPPQYLIDEAKEMLSQNVPNLHLNILGQVNSLGWFSSEKSSCAPSIKTLKRVRFYESNPLLFVLIKSKWLLDKIPELECSQLISNENLIFEKSLSFLRSPQSGVTFSILDSAASLSTVLRATEAAVQSLDGADKVEIVLMGLSDSTGQGSLLVFHAAQKMQDSKLISNADLNSFWRSSNTKTNEKQTYVQEKISPTESTWVQENDFAYEKQPLPTSVSHLCMLNRSQVLKSEVSESGFNHNLENISLPLTQTQLDQEKCRKANEVILKELTSQNNTVMRLSLQQGRAQ